MGFWGLRVVMMLFEFIVDRLTKSAHFIPILMDYSMEKFAKLYITKSARFYIDISIL